MGIENGRINSVSLKVSKVSHLVVFLAIYCGIRPTTPKIGEKTIIKHSQYKPNILMDVASAAFNRNIDNPPKVKNVNIIFYTFVNLGFYVIGIVDRSLGYQIDRFQSYYEKYLKSGYFIEVDYADPELVNASFFLKCCIISNDKFKQYHGTTYEGWLKTHLIPFKIINGKFLLVSKKPRR